MPPSQPDRLLRSIPDSFRFKYRYGLELLARRDRSTLSSFIENLIINRIYDKDEGLLIKADDTEENIPALDNIWHINPGIRLSNLWKLWPELVTSDEQKILFVIANKIGFHMRRAPIAKAEKPVSISDNPLDSFNGQCIICASKELFHLGFHYQTIEANWESIVAKAGGDKTVSFKNLHGISVRASHGANYDMT